jgi:hypothetical protein
LHAIDFANILAGKFGKCAYFFQAENVNL